MTLTSLFMSRKKTEKKSVTKINVILLREHYRVSLMNIVFNGGRRLFEKSHVPSKFNLWTIKYLYNAITEK